MRAGQRRATRLPQRRAAPHWRLERGDVLAHAERGETVARCQDMQALFTSRLRELRRTMLGCPSQMLRI